MMTKPRTKSGFVGVFDVRGVNNFLVGLAERDVDVDVEGRGTGGLFPPHPTRGSEERRELPAGPGAEYWSKTNLVHFICH